MQTELITVMCDLQLCPVMCDQVCNCVQCALVGLQRIYLNPIAQCAAVPVCQCAAVPVCQCAAVPVCQCASVLQCRCASVPV